MDRREFIQTSAALALLPNVKLKETPQTQEWLTVDTSHHLPAKGRAAWAAFCFCYHPINDNLFWRVEFAAQPNVYASMWVETKTKVLGYITHFKNTGRFAVTYFKPDDDGINPVIIQNGRELLCLPYVSGEHGIHIRSCSKLKNNFTTIYGDTHNDDGNFLPPTQKKIWLAASTNDYYCCVHIVKKRIMKRHLEQLKACDCPAYAGDNKGVIFVPPLPIRDYDNLIT